MAFGCRSDEIDADHWYECAEHVSRHITEGTVGVLRAVLVRWMEQLPKMRPEHQKQVGAIGRRILEDAEQKPQRRRWLYFVGIATVCRTFCTDPEQSEHVLRPLIQQSMLDADRIEALLRLTHEAESLVDQAPHLLHDLYRNVLSATDIPDEWRPLGSGTIMAMNINIKDSFTLSEIDLGKIYPKYLDRAPKLALESLAAALDAYPSAVYLRIARANNSIVGDAKVFLTRLWIRRRLAMGPYSMDLRERVAAVINEGEGSQRQVAKRFRVSVSFVTRLLQRRRDAGTLAPKPHGGGPRPVLGFPEQVRLAMLIAEHPDATLNQLKERGGFACTLTTIWRTLRRFRLTYKKKTLHARERDDPKVQAKRRRYRRKVEQMDAKRLVFVDETGINTAMTPTHAWARRGKRAIGSVPTSWGSTTVIAALGLDGVRAPLVFPGATDTQAFQTYVDEVLAPELHPGDVVIFDNLKPHLAPHVAESIEARGPASCPCRRTVRTTTRSRSCGRSSKGNFVGSRRGCEMTCTMLLVRPWTM